MNTRTWRWLALGLLAAGLGLAAASEVGRSPASRPASTPAPAPATRPDTRKVVEVDSVDGLLRAVGPDRIIRLRPGRYDLTEANQVKHPHVLWRKEFDGWGVWLRKVSNLKIEGMGEKPVSLTVRPRYAYVLSLERVVGLELVNLQLGHSPDPGACAGGVVQAKESNSIALRGCDLFGCGTEGLWLREVHGLVFEKSVIRDCTEGILVAEDCSGLVFRDSQFKDNKVYSIFDLNGCGKVSMSGCRIENNRHVGEGLSPLFELGSGTELTLEKCKVARNTYKVLANPESALRLVETGVKDNRTEGAGAP